MILLLVAALLIAALLGTLRLRGGESEKIAVGRRFTATSA